MAIDLGDIVNVTGQARGFALGFDSTEAVAAALGPIPTLPVGLFDSFNAVVLDRITDIIDAPTLTGISAIADGMLASMATLDVEPWGLTEVEWIGQNVVRSMVSQLPKFDLDVLGIGGGVADAFTAAAAGSAILGVERLNPYRLNESIPGLRAIDEVALGRAVAFAPPSAAPETPHQSDGDQRSCTAQAPALARGDDLELVGDFGSAVAVAAVIRQIRVRTIPAVFALAIVMGILVLQAATGPLDLDAFLLALTIGVGLYRWLAAKIAAAEGS